MTTERQTSSIAIPAEPQPEQPGDRNKNKIPHALEGLPLTVVHSHSRPDAIQAVIVAIFVHIDKKLDEYALLYLKDDPSKAHTRHLTKVANKHGWDTRNCDAVARVSIDKASERRMLYRILGFDPGRHPISLLPLIDARVGVAQDQTGNVRFIVPPAEPNTENNDRHIAFPHSSGPTLSGSHSTPPRYGFA